MRIKNIVCILFFWQYILTTSCNWKSSSEDFIEVYPNGKKKAEGIMSNGINGPKEGKWIGWYKNGKTEYIGIYSNGKAIYRWAFFHENGALSKIADYHNGQLNGLYISYYHNQVIKEKGNYILDKPVGIWYFNDTLGRLIGTKDFIDGMANRNEKYYYLNGQIDSEYVVRNNYLNGIYKTYYADGEIQTVSLYKDSKLLARKKYGFNGELISDYLAPNVVKKDLDSLQ